MNNIPIYRGKRVDSDEYVEGCLNIWEQNEKIYYSIMEIDLYPSPFDNINIIDPTTLAIKTTEIDFFMSLDVETGKGGDIVQLEDGTKETMECVFYKGRASYKDNDGRYHWYIHYNNAKAIGIKE